MFVIFLTALLGALLLYTYILNTKHKNFPPGPISLPVIGTLYLLGTQPHKKLLTMKNKYGAILRIDFGAYLGIVLNDYKAIKEAFNLPAFNGRPNYEILAQVRDHGNEGTIFVNGRTWEEQRKFIFDYLRNVRKDKTTFEEIIVEQLQHLRKDLNEKTGKPFQERNIFNTSAVAPMWFALTGTSANPNDAQFKCCVDLMTKMAESFSSAGAVFFMPTVCKLFPNVTGWNNVLEYAAKNVEFVKLLLQPYKSSFSDHEQPKNLIEEYLYKIKTTEDVDSSFFGETGDKNLTTTIWDILLAGTETVSTAMTWFITLISYNPHVQRKIQEDIEKVVGNKNIPCLEDRVNLPYIEACIYEVLRFSSISPLSTPRATVADVYFRGYFIPKGTVVVPNLYGALHDPTLWEDPDSFSPERFLSKDGTSILRDKAQLTNFAFGYGKRACPGGSSAKDQMFLLGTGLLQTFNFTLDPSVHKQKIETHLGGTLIPKYKPIIVTKR